MPEPRDSRRLLEDPENEPNFYQITEAYPLPDPTVTALVDVARAIESAAMLQSQARLASARSTINEQEPPAAKRQKFCITLDGSPSTTQKPESVLRPTSNTLDPNIVSAGLLFETPDLQLNDSFINGGQEGCGTVEAGFLTALVLGLRNQNHQR